MNHAKRDAELGVENSLTQKYPKKSYDTKTTLQQPPPCRQR